MALPEKRLNKNAVFLVRGQVQGKAAWHYVEVDRLKLPLFHEALKSGILNVAQFGTIVKSGWGENPPQDVLEAMQKHSKS